jgi:hypothetical protein
MRIRSINGRQSIVVGNGFCQMNRARISLPRDLSMSFTLFFAARLEVNG